MLTLDRIKDLNNTNLNLIFVVHNTENDKTFIQQLLVGLREQIQPKNRCLYHTSAFSSALRSTILIQDPSHYISIIVQVQLRNLSFWILRIEVGFSIPLP